MAHILLISLAYLEQKKESREIKSFCQISFLPSAAYAQFPKASTAWSHSKIFWHVYFGKLLYAIKTCKGLTKDPLNAGPKLAKD